MVQCNKVSITRIEKKEQGNEELLRFSVLLADFEVKTNTKNCRYYASITLIILEIFNKSQ